MEICMNKKRVTAVILSAMMCMQIFTGCGAKNNAAAVEGGVGQTATESAQGAAGTVTEENAQTLGNPLFPHISGLFALQP